MRLLAAPDKFKGTATAAEVGEAIAAAGRECGWGVDVTPLSDGGDGLLDVLGGGNRTTRVTGPLGDPVDAAWRLEGDQAVIESARASGLVLVEHNRPLEATTRGTGELLDAAVAAGAREILLGVGGSATTDGGTGALGALSPSTLAAVRGGEVRVVVCCDVTTRYEDAARVFGPQKGASPGDVATLTGRLRRWRGELHERFGVDVGTIEGGGAAGGLAGGLAAVGAVLRPGFDLVAEHVGLAARLAAADLVITGEGRLDATSMHGKVVGRVVDLAGAVPVVAIVGARDDSAGTGALDVVSLVERFGVERAMGDVVACVRDAAREVLARR